MNKGLLPVQEFVRAMKDYRIDIEENNLGVLLNYLDPEQTGEINYMAFFNKIKGQLSNTRKEVIEYAFLAIDREKTGNIDISSLKEKFNAKKHPDVRSGKKTEDEILGEFLETFEIHLNLINYQGQGITKEIFTEYYELVSSVIENDDYFEQIMFGVWQLGEGVGIEEKQPLSVTQSAPFGTTDAPTDYLPWKKGKGTFKGAEESKKLVAAGFPSWPKVERPRTVQEVPVTKQLKSDNSLVKLFKMGMFSRGRRGAFRLHRVLKILDPSNTGKINYNSFVKIMKEFRIKMTEDDCAKLFKLFDAQNTGSVSIEEVLKTMIGEMTQNRRNLIERVFKMLDRKSEGLISADEIKDSFVASRHPDVLTRKKTEDEILTEFLDTFEEFCYFIKPAQKEGKVALNDLVQYYNCISASIEDDTYFDLMITNTWNLNKAKGY
jgi:Ca2+-binding EF-hand superfamily protein